MIIILSICYYIIAVSFSISTNTTTGKKSLDIFFDWIIAPVILPFALLVRIGFLLEILTRKP